MRSAQSSCSPKLPRQKQGTLAAGEETPLARRAFSSGCLLSSVRTRRCSIRFLTFRDASFPPAGLLRRGDGRLLASRKQRRLGRGAQKQRHLGSPSDLRGCRLPRRGRISRVREMKMLTKRRNLSDGSARARRNLRRGRPPGSRSSENIHNC